MQQSTIGEKILTYGKFFLEKIGELYKNHPVISILVVIALTISIVLGLPGLFIFITLLVFAFIYQKLWQYITTQLNGQVEDSMKPILLWVVYMLTTTVVYITLLFFALILSGIILLLKLLVQ